MSLFIMGHLRRRAAGAGEQCPAYSINPAVQIGFRGCGRRTWLILGPRPSMKAGPWQYYCWKSTSSPAPCPWCHRHKFSPATRIAASSLRENFEKICSPDHTTPPWIAAHGRRPAIFLQTRRRRRWLSNDSWIRRSHPLGGSSQW